mgnify:CR=1 FL=1
MTDQVVFFDSDGEVLRAVRRLLPRAHVMPRVSRPDGLGAALAGLPDVAIVHGDPDSLTPDLRRGVRGLPARIWVNSLGEVDHAVASGAPLAFRNGASRRWHCSGVPPSRIGSRPSTVPSSVSVTLGLML